MAVQASSFEAGEKQAIESTRLGLETGCIDRLRVNEWAYRNDKVDLGNDEEEKREEFATDCGPCCEHTSLSVTIWPCA